MNSWALSDPYDLRQRAPECDSRPGNRKSRESRPEADISWMPRTSAVPDHIGTYSVFADSADVTHWQPPSEAEKRHRSPKGIKHALVNKTATQLLNEHFQQIGVDTGVAGNNVWDMESRISPLSAGPEFRAILNLPSRRLVGDWEPNKKAAKEGLAAQVLDHSGMLPVNYGGGLQASVARRREESVGVTVPIAKGDPFHSQSGTRTEIEVGMQLNSQPKFRVVQLRNSDGSVVQYGEWALSKKEAMKKAAQRIIMAAAAPESLPSYSYGKGW